MNIGNSIKSIRLKKGIKQKVLAERCDIAQAYLSQIENNLREPNISTLKRISAELEVPLPVLFLASMEDSDIKPEKREAFKKIAPSLKRITDKML